MPQQLFHVELGVNLDDLVHILPSDGAPGGDADIQDAASKGSLALDYTNGTIYQKHEVGAGADKWSETSNVLTLSWRAPVVTTDTATWANIAAAEAALNDLSTNGSYVVTSTAGTYDDAGNPVVVGTSAVDETITVTFSDATNFTVSGSVTGAIGAGTVGSDFVSDYVTIPSAGWGGTWAAAETMSVAVTGGGAIGGLAANDYAEGDRILLTDLTTGNENVYIVTGTPGSGATLVEDANTATDGDMLWTSAGAYEDTQWAYTGTEWVQVGQTAANELGFIRAFIGKDGAGAETPDYGAGVSTVGQTDDLETAISKLDAGLEAIGGIATDPSVTTQEPLDEILVDDYDVARWIVHAKDDAGAVRVWEVIATHDGTTAADATRVDYSIYGKQRIGSMPGVRVRVDLNGLTGAAQEMELLVESNNAVAFKSIRMSL